MVILHTMKPPIFVRPLSDAERNTLEAGLRPQRMPSLCAVAEDATYAYHPYDEGEEVVRGPRGHRRRLAGGAGRTRHLGSELPSPGGRGAAGGSRGDDELHQRRVLLEPVDVALRRGEPMR